MVGILHIARLRDLGLALVSVKHTGNEGRKTVDNSLTFCYLILTLVEYNENVGACVSQVPTLWFGMPTSPTSLLPTN